MDRMCPQNNFLDNFKYILWIFLEQSPPSLSKYETIARIGMARRPTASEPILYKKYVELYPKSAKF